MPYDPQAIRTELKTILATITELAFVYDRRNPNIEGFPAVIFDITRTEDVMLTNTQNERTITFTLWVIQEIGVIGADTANEILDNATKKVVEKLENIAQLSLNSNVDWTLPVAGGRQEVATPQGSAIWQELELRAKVVSSVL